MSSTSPDEDEGHLDIENGHTLIGMRSEWLPLSASALVTGAMALLMSVFIMPQAGGDGVEASLRVAEANAGQWTAMSMLWALSSIGLLLGVPSILTLFQRRGKVLGYIGGVVLAVGAVGLSGLAALAVLFRGLAERNVGGEMVATAMDEPDMRLLLGAWIFSLFLGMVVIGVALLRAKTVPVWVPLLLLAFVAFSFLPVGNELVENGSFVALAASFTGMAVYAVDPTRHQPKKKTPALR